tara:strand:- start:3 stop:458 length:456 start_codon:yes stop_codon:yes gene_type:complete
MQHYKMTPLSIKKTLFTFIFVAFSVTLSAQTIFGKWNSKNEDTGEIDSVIEIYKENSKAYARVVKVMDPKRQDVICELCEGSKKGQKILGMNILDGLEKDGKEWSGGTILDPRNGNAYKCYILLEKPNKLKIRGYIGISLFGKTAYWERAE